MYKILIVEDEESLRFLLQENLELEGYEVQTASNGDEGFEALQKSKFHMVISDINMPGMSGFDFLEKVKEHFAGIPFILMTAYNVDDYMELINSHKIGNIVTKGVPFNTEEFLLTVKQLLTRDIFGLDKHMEPNTRIDMTNIYSPPQIDEISNALALVYGTEQNFRKLRTVFVELLTNALFYGAKDEDGAAKDEWNTDFVLNPENAIRIYHAKDKYKIGIGIIDYGGKLDQETILYWMNRQISANEKGLPQGIFDSHGRGLFITRKYVDRFIINVEKGKRCECIILNYYDNPPTEFKPIRINEI